MMEITRITNIDNNKHIALLDTSSISFMQELEGKGIKNFHRLIDHEKTLKPHDLSDVSFDGSFYSLIPLDAVFC